MDRFEAMSLLLAVVDKGSFSAAGRALNVPVATLSRKVSELEASLGTRLLTRTTRKLSLTDTGATYVAASRRIIEQVEEAEREAAGEFIVPKGDLVISAPILFGRLHVLPIVTDFLALFPEINIRLLLADRNVDLVDDHVDMAVRIGELPDSSIVATRVGSMRTMVCGSPGFLRLHGTPAEPADLADLACVSLGAPAPTPAWTFKSSAGGVTQISVKNRLIVSTAEAALEAAISGVGLTRLLHYQLIDAVSAGKLRIVLEPFEPDPVPVHLIHVSRGQMPLKMRRFLDMAAPRLRQLLGPQPTAR